DGECFAGAGDAEQHLIAQSGANAFNQLRDGSRLIALRLERGREFEIHQCDFFGRGFAASAFALRISRISCSVSAAFTSLSDMASFIVSMSGCIDRKSIFFARIFARVSFISAANAARCAGDTSDANVRSISGCIWLNVKSNRPESVSLEIRVPPTKRMTRKKSAAPPQPNGTHDATSGFALTGVE